MTRSTTAWLALAALGTCLVGCAAPPVQPVAASAPVPAIAPSPEMETPPAPAPTGVEVATTEPTDPATIASDIAGSFEILQEEREDAEREREERYQKSLSGGSAFGLGSLGATGPGSGGFGTGGGVVGGLGLGGVGGGGRGYGKAPPRKRATVSVAVASVAAPRSQADVQALLARHQHRIATCQERHGKGQDWTATLRFVVEPGGALGLVVVGGPGPEPARSCIADLLSRLKIKGTKNGKSRVAASLDLAGP